METQDFEPDSKNVHGKSHIWILEKKWFIREAIDQRMTPDELMKRHHHKPDAIFIENPNLHYAPSYSQGILVVLWYKKKHRLGIVIKTFMDDMSSIVIISKSNRTTPFLSGKQKSDIRDFYIDRLSLQTLFCRCLQQVCGDRFEQEHFYQKHEYSKSFGISYPFLSCDGKISTFPLGPDIMPSPSYTSNLIPKELKGEAMDLSDSLERPNMESVLENFKRKEPEKSSRIHVLYVHDDNVRRKSTRPTVVPESYKGSIFCLAFGETCVSSKQYTYQTIWYLSDDHVAWIAEQQLSKLDLYKFLSTESLGHEKFIVPLWKTYRVKLVTANEFDRLTNCEEVVNNLIRYKFDMEDRQLSETCGILLFSTLVGHELTKENQMSFQFAKVAFACYQLGFGSRHSCRSKSLNRYMGKRCTPRSGKTPTVGIEHVQFQQYYRKAQSFPLIQICLEKQLDDLTTRVVQIARSLHPEMQTMVEKACMKSILTCGVPSRRIKEVPIMTESTSVESDDHLSLLAFLNVVHVDRLDKLGERRKDKLREFAKTLYAKRLLDFDDFCVSTTCGYQAIFNTRNGSPFHNSELRQHFVMNGLGITCPIVTTRTIHFLGGSFSHCSSLAYLVRENKLIFSNSREDYVVMLGWGKGGGSKEMKQVLEELAEKREQNCYHDSPI
jgi:hypothetical protein